MGIQYSVKAQVKDVMRDLSKAQREVVPESTVAALNRAASRMQTAAVRETASTLQIKPKVARGLLRFQRRDRARRLFWTAGIYVVIGDLPASKLGKMRQQKKGAKAGKYFFEGAFKATIKQSNHTGIYKRKGKPRFPIVEQRVKIRDKVEPIIIQKIQTVGIPEFNYEFHRQLQWRLRRRGLL